MADLADLFRRVTTGVYVIGVAEGERRNAFTAAWLTQVSFDPLLLALSVNPEHASYPLLLGGGGFAVSVLRRDQVHDRLRPHLFSPLVEPLFSVGHAPRG